METYQPCRKCGGTGKELNHAVIGSQMKAERVRLGLSLEELGKAVGYSRQHIHSLERGERRWSSRLVERFNDALHHHAEK
ncbi:MAG TPA: helix-turn-helix transcriptional regulator [Verrucomicrobiota bacterium]|nr:helix-turn-helix transcriptional regulator [Verrucomicrobiota bacterium]HNS69007.1 helix-turn-helix transcriptional regulator [Verrucomicrobiota bacterium]